MARIRPLKNDEVSEETAALFAEIEAAFGMVPNIFRTMAHYPPLLSANWDKLKKVLFTGALDRRVKEAIAVLVSGDNSCNYCVAAHRGGLKAVGMSEKQIVDLEEDLDKTDFSEKDKALVRFARKANLDPLRMQDDEFAALKKSGASDAEILEALGVMEIFTGFNKTLDVLQVEIDF